ncbi:MAG: ATP-binding protein [Acholeplasma sp.]|jgi:predicted AAA+ superfamily ATPase|nr:MAG: ATP-binding protein [Acholeplasma sp.]
MIPKNYRKRLIEQDIADKMKYSGGVVIEGPKWVGKSTTAELFSKTIIRLQNPITKKQYQTLATISKDEVLAGEKPILFDEWQEVPEIWDFIRLDIDENKSTGSYLLTGSTKKQNLPVSHTGTGRITSITMRPMSLFESGDSSGSVSLESLFNGEVLKPVKSRISINDIAQYICRGGWPGSIDLDTNDQLSVVRDLLESLIKRDVDEVDGIKKDKEKIRKLLRSYARNISTLVTSKTIYQDQINEDLLLDYKTFDSYVNALQRLFIIENVKAWGPKIKSSSTIRTSDKKQFVDPSIAVAALGLSPEKLKNDFNTFGFFFESICTRDIRIYAQKLKGSVFHYLDSSGLEIDLIIELSDGRWAGIEVKMGENEVDKAADNLIKLASLHQTTKPSFLMIVTNTQLGYQRQDGVYVVPIGCLKP